MRQIAEQYGLDLIVVFGSQVTGRARPGSDFQPYAARRYYDAQKFFDRQWNDLKERVRRGKTE